MKSLLVPTDFSGCSINALRYTVQLAQNLKIEEVFIMHAFISPSVYGDLGISSWSNKLAQEQKLEIEEGFKMLEKAVPELQEIKYSFHTEQAMLLEAITSLSHTLNIDLIVMGTAETETDEVSVGSNAYAITRKVKCPVLIIPENADYHPIYQIVLANDFKSLASKTWDTLKILSKAYGSIITIVHIKINLEAGLTSIKEIKKTERYFKHIRHTYHYLKNSNVKRGLEEYAQKYKFDLLTLVPRNHSLFGKLFGDNHAKSIIFHTKTPLLALPELN